MLKRIQKTIVQHELIFSDEKVLIAISGGPDSVALLLALRELGYELIIAHVNYQSRGQDSIADEKFVIALAEELKLPCEVKRVKLDNKKAGFEARAREIRYEFFEKVLEKHQVDKIAIAHNSDDLVETMLLHLLRGAGARGLAGMAYQRDKIVRPLLDVTRVEIEDYLKQKKQTYRFDKSNKDIRYKRNWVRWRLLPYLRENVNANIDQQLRQSARSFGELADWLEETAQDKIKQLKTSDNSYKLSPFLQLSKVLQGEIIRQLLGKQDITRKHVSEVMSVLEKSESKKQKTFKGITIEKRKGRFVVK